MNPGIFFDAWGNPIKLGKELGRGGEGIVYSITGSLDTVAKIYLRSPGKPLAEKLSAMVSIKNSNLLEVAAWPTAVLNDAFGMTVGFTMRGVGACHPIFKLYLPKFRLQAFPKADWRFLIHVAANTARAFATVHSAGLVIGDVNHGNLVVAKDATVQMIDCDSFQLSQGGRTWFCTVGVGTHQPPEMQGRYSYAGIVRTPNHDNFGLAVLIFQLLCLARHPFAGSFIGTGEPPSIEEAITASRYAYSQESSRTKMAAPPGSLPIGALSLELQDLFEQAFAFGVSQVDRPTADRWVEALGRLANDVQLCWANPAHVYRTGLTTCPWCAIENTNGITLFPIVFVSGAAETSSMAVLWHEVSGVPEPRSLDPWPEFPPGWSSPSPEAIQAGKNGRKLGIAALVSIVVPGALAFLVGLPDVKLHYFPISFMCAVAVYLFTLVQHFYKDQKADSGPFGKRVIEARQDWETLRSSWVIQVSNESFNEVRNSLLQHKAEYDNLPAWRATRLQRLREQYRTKRLKQHLDLFLIASAMIPGIDSLRVAALSDSGITTAGDIVSSRVLMIPDLGPTVLASLLAWRQTHECSFQFNPDHDVSPADLALIERSVEAHRKRLERMVQVELVRLKSVSAASAMRVQALNDSMAELASRLTQALVDQNEAPEFNQLYLRVLIMAGVLTAIALISYIA